MCAVLCSIVYCIVGCNTGSADQQALHVIECDTETGAAKIVQSVSGIQGTTYFQLDRAREYLYSAIAENGKGCIVRFPIKDHKLGAMERIAALPCETPCHVSLAPDGRRIAFAAYSSATCGTVGIDGSGLKTYVFPDDDMGGNEQRQQKAFAHQAFFLDGETLGVVDLGCDRIRFFDPATMTPKGKDIKTDSGDGPRHVAIPSSGGFIYLVNELSSSVAAYAAAADGFKRIGKWTTLPAAFNRWRADGKTLATKAAAIKLSADGKMLMASNRGCDSIAFFRVSADGSLAPKNIAPLAGKFPRDFELMPGEKFVVVGHKMSNEIQIYAIDREKYTLLAVGKPLAVWRPLCFKFL